MSRTWRAKTDTKCDLIITRQLRPSSSDSDAEDDSKTKSSDFHLLFSPWQAQICSWYRPNGRKWEELKSLLMRVKNESEKAGSTFKKHSKN